MKKFYSLILTMALLSGCSSLSYTEKTAVRSLKSQGITVEKPVGPWEAPASAGAAGGLNLLPGIGNFYLASGEGAEKSHYLYGFLNLLMWPLSIVWGIPEAAIDANTINERELVYFYTYDEAGKQSLRNRGFELTATGQLQSVQ